MDAKLDLTEACICNFYDHANGQLRRPPLDNPLPECPDCKGSGQRPTLSGRELIEFIRRYVMS